MENDKTTPATININNMKNESNPNLFANQIEEIEVETLNLFRVVSLKSEKRSEDGEDFSVSFLDPQYEQVLTARKICRKFEEYTKEMIRFFNSTPLNEQNIAEIIERIKSYILFERIGKNLDENTWKKLYVKEFTALIDILKVLIDDAIKYFQFKSQNFKCFRNSSKCSLKINYSPQKVFVIMPFVKELADIYEFGIKETIQNLGFECSRADEVIHVKDILCLGICKQIQESNFIIADLSLKNPNVFYELGLAHGFEKDIILITNNIDDVPFDMRSMNLIVYNNSIKELKKQLSTICKNLYN